MTKPSVGIVGCGWLGKALTTELIEHSHDVVVTTQRPENLALLTAYGARVECFSATPFSHHKSHAECSSELSVDSAIHLNVFKQSCLVIAITPMIRQGKKDYAEKVHRIVKLAEAGNVKQIILISSTAIYNGNVGDVDESASIDLSQEKPRIMNDAEQIALSFTGDSIILRFAGLVGPDRHPGKFLTGNRLLSDPEAVTNLIHQKDAVGLLFKLIKQAPHTNIYNGSSHTNVFKRDYYGRAAEALGLAPPKFNKQTSPVNSKKIISDKIRERLNYQFIYDDLLMWLDEK